MLKKEIYQEIITEVRDKIAKKIIDEEKYLAQRATVIDKDIGSSVKVVGMIFAKVNCHVL